MTVLDAPVRANRPEGHDGRPRSTWPVVVTLARVEGRRMARHPLLWTGVALGGLLLAPSVWPFRFVLPRESAVVQVAALPIALTTLVVAHLATTRPRRDGVDELLGAGAHGEDTRTFAMLLAVLGPTTVAATLVAVVLGTAAAMGGVGPVWWTEAATAPALVAGGGALGVVLGRLAPWRLAALFAVVGIVVVQLFLSETGGPGDTTPTEVLGPVVLPSAAPHDPTAMLRPAGWHLLYVLGGAGAAAAAAALASRVTARRAVVFVVALGLAGTAGVVQMRPPTEEALEAALARTSDPVAAGECTEDQTGATVCALAPTLGWRAGWVGVVEAVRSPLVERSVALPAVTVAQRAAPSQVEFEASRWYDAEATDVQQHVTAAWDAEYQASGSTVLVTSEWPRGSGTVDPGRLDLALHVARHAVGLPAGFAFVHHADDGSTEGTTACSPVGQAREAVAIWLAAHADPAAAGALHAAVAAQPYPGTPADPIDDGSGFADVTTGLTLSTGAVAGLSPGWSKPGAHVALQMLDLPADEVRDRVAAEWARWTDPATPLRDLVDELGLAMPPLAADLQRRLGGGTVGDDLDRAFRDTPLPTPVLETDGTAVLDHDPHEQGAPLGCP